MIPQPNTNPYTYTGYSFFKWLAFHLGRGKQIRSTYSCTHLKLLRNYLTITRGKDAIELERAHRMDADSRSSDRETDACASDRASEAERARPKTDATEKPG